VFKAIFMMHEDADKRYIYIYLYLKKKMMHEVRLKTKELYYKINKFINLNICAHTHTLTHSLTHIYKLNKIYRLILKLKST